MRERCWWVAVLLVVALSAVPVRAETVEGGADGSEALSLGFYIDVGALDAVVSEHLYLRGGAVLRLSEALTLEMPVTCVFQDDEVTGERMVLLDMGLLLKYYPGLGGLWSGISLFQGLTFLGDDRPAQIYHHMTEIAFGYTFSHPSGWFIEPSCRIRDPLKTFHDSLEYVTGLIPAYGDVRFSIDIGWFFELPC